MKRLFEALEHERDRYAGLAHEFENRPNRELVIVYRVLHGIFDSAVEMWIKVKGRP